MSYSTVHGVVPIQRPTDLLELRNSHGWAPSIWRRLLTAHGHDENWITNDAGLTVLWQQIETLPEWQQAPLVLTFDTGVIPFQAYEWAADQLDEFERQIPAPEGHANHVPTVAALFRSMPEVPLIGVYGTSVSEDPFDPWDSAADAPGSGIPLSAMYVLGRHRSLVEGMQ